MTGFSLREMEGCWRESRVYGGRGGEGEINFFFLLVCYCLLIMIVFCIKIGLGRENLGIYIKIRNEKELRGNIRIMGGEGTGSGLK